MSRFLAVLALAIMAAGCHGQVPPTPPIATCPAATVGGTAYTPLNPVSNNTTPASVTGTTYNDTPTTGSWCYIVQSWAIVAPATVYQVSVPSNVAGPLTTTSNLPVVALSWTAPAAGYTYIVSRAPAAVVAAPTAPVLSPGATAAMLEKPKPAQLKAVASR